MRVSKADGAQVLDLQRDALIAAGVHKRNLYSDMASGKRDDRPGLEACLKALRDGDTRQRAGAAAEAQVLPEHRHVDTGEQRLPDEGDHPVSEALQRQADPGDPAVHHPVAGAETSVLRHQQSR